MPKQSMKVTWIRIVGPYYSKDDRETTRPCRPLGKLIWLSIRLV